MSKVQKIPIREEELDPEWYNELKHRNEVHEIYSQRNRQKKLGIIPANEVTEDDFITCY